MSSNIPMQVRTALQNLGLPAPTLAWIQSALPNRNPLPPMPALIATVKTRLLALDLTIPGILEPPAPAFPPNLHNPEVRELKLSRDTLVQVLDIENITKSKWEQVEELEAIARGEQTRGREIIRLNENEDEDNGAQANNNEPQQQQRPAPAAPTTAAGSRAAAAAASKNATHRLLLQDCRGQTLHGLELRRVERVGIGTMSIGEKILLKRGTVVARGVVLLEPPTCTVFGGKVDAWHRAWVESRLARLKEAAGADARG
ncbi:hypothetical protein F4821DRAFT_249521 [Hypoxylon rubiginosum]|uniref:Uncharacterized protein n=1 Tax=Hypoxylon rubiginosum TaxID=110542 RepID=A0ACC0CLP4_9PEZI|nr:hypothetical protein F4821DRAFT_249521 [Hypoxylon rubiginosum]